STSSPARGVPARGNAEKSAPRSCAQARAPVLPHYRTPQDDSWQMNAVAHWAATSLALSSDGLPPEACASLAGTHARPASYTGPAKPPGSAASGSNGGWPFLPSALGPRCGRSRNERRATPGARAQLDVGRLSRRGASRAGFVRLLPQAALRIALA